MTEFLEHRLDGAFAKASLDPAGYGTLVVSPPNEEGPAQVFIIPPEGIAIFNTDSIAHTFRFRVHDRTRAIGALSTPIIRTWFTVTLGAGELFLYPRRAVLKPTDRVFVSMTADWTTEAPTYQVAIGISQTSEVT